jgi:hypothetical protein
MSPNAFFSQPVFVPGGDPRTFNEPSLLYPGQLGIRFQYKIPPRQDVDAVESSETGRPHGFQLVHTDSTMATSPYDGAVAWWANQAAYRVTTNPATLGRGRVAGVFKTAVTPGYYCCVQQSGISGVKFIDVPTAAPSAAGLIVIPSATDGKADCLAAGSAATYPILGRTVGALQGGTAVALVDLDVPEVY